MDSFELNKIIGAILMTALIVIGINKVSDVIFHVDKPKESAYKVEGVELASSSSQTSAQVKEVVQIDIKEVLAMGNIAHGEKVFKKCKWAYVF